MTCCNANGGVYRIEDDRAERVAHESMEARGMVRLSDGWVIASGIGDPKVRGLRKYDEDWHLVSATPEDGDWHGLVRLPDHGGIEDHFLAVDSQRNRIVEFDGDLGSHRVLEDLPIRQHPNDLRVLPEGWLLTSFEPGVLLWGGDVTLLRGEMQQPHSATYHRGELAVCESAKGLVHVGDRTIPTDGFPRGLLSEEDLLYIGVSSMRRGRGPGEDHAAVQVWDGERLELVIGLPSPEVYEIHGEG